MIFIKYQSLKMFVCILFLINHMIRLKIYQELIIYTFVTWLNLSEKLEDIRPYSPINRKLSSLI